MTIDNIVQDIFENIVILNSRGRCKKDSYKAGTFECDPALSDAKEEVSNGDRRSGRKDKDRGSTGGGRGQSDRSNGNSDGKRGKSEVAGISGSNNVGERNVEIEGLGIVRMEDRPETISKGLKQIEVLRDNASELQKISTIKDVKDWMKNNGVKELTADASVKERSPTNRIISLLKKPEFTSLSVFDRARIAAQMERGERKRDYAGNFIIKHNRVGNMKMSDTLKIEGEGEFTIIGGDTVQGCDQMCYECYANKMTNIPGIRHQNAVKAILKGDIFPNEIMRIGTNGEPAKSWKHTSLQVRDLIKRSNERIENNIAKGRSVDDGKRVSAEKNIFFVSKMLNIDDWDPEVIKNVEVSMDPLYPDHMRQTMSNVMRIKVKYPDTNFVMRIRSIASKDPAIMAVQEDAVEFANALGLPVLETKLRFVKGVSEQVLNLDMSKYSRHDTGEPILDKDGNPKTDKDGKYVYRKENQLKLNAPLLKEMANNIRVCNEKNVGVGACAACHACYDLNISSKIRSENIKKSKEALKKLNIDVSKINAPTNLDVTGTGQYGARGVKTKKDPKITSIKVSKKSKGVKLNEFEIAQDVFENFIDLSMER